MAFLGNRGRREQVPDRNLIPKELVEFYAQSGFEKKTLNQYNSHVQKYVNYCNTLELRPWPAEMETVEGFMAWLIHTGRPGSLKGAYSALNHELTRRRLPTLGTKKSLILKQLERTAEKEMVKNGAKPRDAFLSEMARHFCENMNLNSRHDVQCAAILTVGLRGLLRAGELMGLKFKHIRNHLGYQTLEFETRKNARSRVPLIFLDATGNITCPVACLKRWVKWREMEGPIRPDDYVFNTKPGNSIRISYKIIADMVRKAAKAAGYKDLNVSGHSLRIGGATEAMMAGFSELEIRIMGDWKSNAYMRYLRAVQPAAMGASARMGL